MSNIKNILDSLNEAQRLAATHKEGPLLVFAGAGSGKTRVITARIAYLISEGVDASSILAITFTNKAAKEMKERVKSATNGAWVWVATFHSVCIRMLRENAERLGFGRNFSIYDRDDSLATLKIIIKECHLEGKAYTPEYLANIISAQKNVLRGPMEYSQLNPANFRSGNYARVYEEYQKRLQRQNAMDFDDVIFYAVVMLSQNPDILERYRKRFKYVLVDEYQDTNQAQYRFVSLLAGESRNIFAVGDDDQAIYGWRGADIENILNFERDFPDSKVARLEQNYRSTANILSAANAFIRKNKIRAEKTLWTQKDGGEKIFVFEAEDERLEAAYVSDVIRERYEKGEKYSSFAVLYRTHAQSRAIEERFVASSIPYRLLSGVRFYSRREIKDLLAYLYAISNSNDDVSVSRILNAPKRGIGNVSIEKLNEYAFENSVSLYEAIGNANEISELKPAARKSILEFYKLMSGFIRLNAQKVSGILKNIIKAVDYMNYLDDGTDEGVARIENVEELLVKAEEFDETFDGEGGLSAFLEDVALLTSVDNHNENDDAVVLMTLHSAKGLEFTNVFLIGMEEGGFPLASAFDDAELEEERRLAYVGFTRAKERLYLAYAKRRFIFTLKNRFQSDFNSPSRFLEEIPAELCQKGKSPSKSVAPISPRRKPLSKIENPYKVNIPAPKNASALFAPGDRVKQIKYGSGVVIKVEPAGADYEVTVDFDFSGQKKIMAKLSKLMPDKSKN